MMTKTVIKIENLTKEYKMFSKKSDRILETLFFSKNRHKTFLALNNLSRHYLI